MGIARIAQRPSRDNLVALREEAIAKMGAKEASAARDDRTHPVLLQGFPELGTRAPKE